MRNPETMQIATRSFGQSTRAAWEMQNFLLSIRKDQVAKAGEGE